jgi:hypothetical protein
VRRLLHWLFPPDRDTALTEEGKRMNSALEQVRRQADEATLKHREATKRLNRAMADSIELAQEAMRERKD